ncbi:NACHT domain-containing NTPase [Lentzea sp. HUAS12]|uniref:NACHT domain-containing protein n=1 Tax=Lentzea sp. HUAS12 TaxID=2951806 RepID=UPI00209C903A|nr:NACHT domain-containing protein [Lentzea sp. HUAS12]USX48409.1 NACHT domain-containing protein [Lentzea sp. HUAS12]
MAGIESMVIRVVVDVSDKLSDRLTEELPRPAVTSAATADLFTDLVRSDAEALQAYLDSPDFATVVAQKRIGNMAGKAAKDQLREGLRLAGMSDHPLSRVTDIVHDVMVAACDDVDAHFGRTSGRIDRGDLYTAATNNSVLLKRLKSSARIHTFAARMRDQVIALHSRIRMPHVGVSRSVRYDQLYVEPALISKSEFRIGAPGERVLVQGDPGAGKSTLAAKLAHDVAADGQVPFLLVLREFATSFDEGGRDLLHYLEKVCQAPYNVKPPRDGVEYLLRTGRAVVILDGLDELVQTELRRRVVSLVEGFAHLYPLVPILVTARKVGYEDAPLSTDLFVPSHIAEFDDDQVAAYVSRWFKLDEATSPAEQDQLISSFMEDSAQISELRSNALLLTLLCAMYSSDRYLPHNLAQVYERCALMLFEQWDSKRGIDLPLRFHGRLRGAVQHLAWNMFSAAESGKPQTRTRVINTLAAYLDKKLDDHDESVAMAEEFLAHCTGRAWILADVGATESEPQFGFTHRTFLEYFAAEYLVRTHRTAEALWAVLKPHVDQWDVVAQIVLQLYDRNVEGGADELLSEALADGGLGFAARALHHVAPSDRVVRSIVTAALDQFVSVPVSVRTGPFSGETAVLDVPLQNCVLNSSHLNKQLIDRTLSDQLEKLVVRGEIGATVVIDTLFDRAEGWNAVRAELWELRKSSPWARWAVNEPELLREIIRRAGVAALYAECNVGDTRYVAAATLLLLEEGFPFSTSEADSIAATMTLMPTPWLETSENAYGEHFEHDSLHLMLCLPYLETFDERSIPDGWHNVDEIGEPVRAFLLAWERGEISVLAQDQ